MKGFLGVALVACSFVLLACLSGADREVSADEISFVGDLPEPATAWQRPDPVDGEYCCSCQKLSGHESIQLTGAGAGFDTCVGCAIACRGENKDWIADGTTSKGGKCS